MMNVLCQSLLIAVTSVFITQSVSAGDAEITLKAADKKPLVRMDSTSQSGQKSKPSPVHVGGGASAPASPKTVKRAQPPQKEGMRNPAMDDMSPEE